MPITSRECGEGHLTIQCPLRSSTRRARSWAEITNQQREVEANYPFHCEIASHPGKGNLRVSSQDVKSFWEDIQFAQSQSIYRDFAGIIDRTNGVLHPLEPGEYACVGRTNGLSLQELYDVLDAAREALNRERPLSEDKVTKVHSELALVFNHFSLNHEGSNLSIDDIQMITTLLGGKDAKRQPEVDELENIHKRVPGSKHDITEAINHILVTKRLQEMAKNEMSETLVPQIHSAVMDGLLKNVEEGLPGEYRKVSINIMGEDSHRPNFADVPPLMKRWCSKDLVQNEDEHIIDYLSRIH
ncbi:expressed unknown protein [Seminavis robusta]|uniref:Uncharacterized protein n=1 Tax=Seminavis robusta TaxID=568900 RepID=A0A9N8HKV4_9STRA|nr:expressed unknown protein [Seminavis robusta]|eukprot:Sro762_g198740.1 n/a (300) ;mRNA; r:32383-33282